MRLKKAQYCVTPEVSTTCAHPHRHGVSSENRVQRPACAGELVAYSWRGSHLVRCEGVQRGAHGRPLRARGGSVDEQHLLSDGQICVVTAALRHKHTCLVCFSFCSSCDVQNTVSPPNSPSEEERLLLIESTRVGNQWRAWTQNE